MRSVFEETIAARLSGWNVAYEAFLIPYEPPAKTRHYKPDWVLSNGIIIEAKGKFEVEDRHKHIWIKKQHPKLDIRFVFQRPMNRIYKGSKTTYVDWAEAFNFKWAKKTVPDAWLMEPTSFDSLEAIIDIIGKPFHHLFA